MVFLSTLSLRRATRQKHNFNSYCLDFYPRSPCGERRALVVVGELEGGISIHALLAESDNRNYVAPRLTELFLSTLSLRRATSSRSSGTLSSIFLSTLSLRRATPSTKARTTPTTVFLSTLSLRRATVGLAGARRASYISIHALLAESDFLAFFRLGFYVYFYPRSPCGERHRTDAKSPSRGKGFLSTLSLRRATFGRLPVVRRSGYFYPRSPCGERHLAGHLRHHLSDISIHALLAESDSGMPLW